MPHQLEPILLAGTGAMAAAYAKVLQAQGQPFIVVGRGAERAHAFAAEWNVPVTHGALADQLAAMPQVPKTAIVAVSANSLASASATLAQHGVQRLLIEKPAALSSAEAKMLHVQLRTTGAQAFVAYNRRFYAAAETARRIIAEDGGAVSCKFDFTEAVRRIEALNKPADELAGWFYGNSTHVVDLAFFLAGTPTHLVAESRGGLAWHPSGAVFTGHGSTDKGAAFSYHANWLSPGRWGVEVMTKARRLVLQPMEKLSCQTHDSFALNPVEIDEADDLAYKPGVYRQTAAFLAGKPDDRLLTLDEQMELFAIYDCIRDGGTYSND